MSHETCDGLKQSDCAVHTLDVVSSDKRRLKASDILPISV